MPQEIFNSEKRHYYRATVVVQVNIQVFFGVLCFYSFFAIILNPIHHPPFKYSRRPNLRDRAREKRGEQTRLRS